MSIEMFELKHLVFFVSVLCVCTFFFPAISVHLASISVYNIILKCVGVL